MPHRLEVDELVVGLDSSVGVEQEELDPAGHGVAVGGRCHLPADPDAAVMGLRGCERSERVALPRDELLVGCRDPLRIAARPTYSPAAVHTRASALLPADAARQPRLAPVLDALTHILDAHMPYPAIVIDRYGDIVAANVGQRHLTDGCAGHLHANAYRLALHPDGMAPRIANFADWARHVLNAMTAELDRNPDERLAARHAELSQYVPPASGRDTWDSPSRCNCARPTADCA